MLCNVLNEFGFIHKKNLWSGADLNRLVSKKSCTRLRNKVDASRRRQVNASSCFSPERNGILDCFPVAADHLIMKFQIK
jgi:hypothetical protein